MKDLVWSKQYIYYPPFIISEKNDALSQRKRKFFYEIGSNDRSTSTDSRIAMNKNVCAGDILIDKLVGKIEKLRKLLFGRVIDG